VGNIAINDSFMIEAAIYKILSRRFRSRPYYVDILELFHEVKAMLWTRPICSDA
jgi:farnesyl diphosphate synthase